MKEYRILQISSYLIGIGLGILLGLLSVFIVSSTLDKNSILISLLVLIIFLLLPFCVHITKKFGYSFFIISLVMVVVSFVICVIYAIVLRNSALQYQETTTIFKDIMVKVIISHVIFLALSLVIHFRDMKKLKEDSDE